MSLSVAVQSLPAPRSGRASQKRRDSRAQEYQGISEAQAAQGENQQTQDGGAADEPHPKVATGIAQHERAQSR